VHMVRDYLGDNLSRNVSLGELAAVTGLDKYRLVRACTQWFGIPPHALHLRLRLDRARQLLRQGRSPAEVGYETGFYDQAHFTRTFTRSCGITPARYGAAFAVADGSSGDGRAGGTVTAGRKITRDLLGRP
jgi:AraC-like DNA-binding protein